MPCADGIEVYLKPAGEDGEGEAVRFSEVELTPEDDFGSTYYKRCFVPYSDKPISIVIKSSGDFVMGAASTVNIKTGIGEATPEDADELAPKATRYESLQRQEVLRGQEVVVSSYGDKPIHMMKVAETEDVQDGEDNRWNLRTRYNVDEVDVGSISVIVQKKILKEKPQKPGFRSQWYQCGRKYRFEFRPRPDGGETSRHRLIAEDHSSPGQDDLNTHHNAISQESLSSSDRHGLVRGAGVSRQRTRRPPPVCDCPPETHARPQRKAKARSGASNRVEIEAQVPDQERLSPEAKQEEEVEDASERPINQQQAGEGITQPPSSTVKETKARACGKCQKLKKPPKKKKLAWRESIGKWMYVHEDAPDFETPTEEEDDDKTVAEPRDEGVTTPGAEDADEALRKSADDNAVQEPSSNTAIEARAVTEVGRDEQAEDNNGQPATSQTQASISDDVVESSKRQLSAERQDSASKKPRVDIDLTLTDDENEEEDENMMLKHERTDLADRKPMFSEEDIYDEDELEQRLTDMALRREDLQLRKEDLQLRKEDAALQRQRRKIRQRNEGSFAVKKEEVVTIDD